MVSMNVLRKFVVAKSGLIVNAPRSISEESVFLSGPQPPPPPLLSAKCAAPLPCEPCAIHARRVLVSEDQTVVLSADRPRMVSPDSVLLSSSLSPLTNYSIWEHQPSSTYSLCHDHESSHIFDNIPYYSFDSFTKPCSPNDSESSSQYEINSESFSHLICPENIDDFGADILYGKGESVTSSASSHQPIPIEGTPDFSFIDEIYESVKAEIHAEKSSAGSQNSPCIRPETPIITLAPDQPVTIVGGDGKEYRVVLQTVKKDSAELKRKADAAVSSPAPKRAKGVPLTNMTIDEISSRKREQNRIAAQRYRQKQKKVKYSEKEEEERLMKRNEFLRSETTRLQQEIKEMKQALLGSLGRTGED
ncbi:hypothetical protein Y032_0171g335 [Ancylostoma ceylanicum]|uniref:BZIP domain-containing protein n=1 Tax=Ancylostoma ceylanicum TaxID=53326 RepID=A0A016SUW4_9BILA|nr:hypothetical protein Y032_0171g335 [Ancylostoma ceylanicum]